MRSVDVVIVGAGPAGIGMALELNKIEGLEYEILESNRIGESFRRWPSQTRFISPSFYSNPFGLADLNSVDATSSPAALTGKEHLSGDEYADYLTFTADEAMLPIICDCKVLKVNSDPDGEFHLVTKRGELFTRYLIWACGEFQFPELKPFIGGEHCLHYAHIKDWQALKAPSYTVIGGYESALDSTINLLTLGCHVNLLVRGSTLNNSDVFDPSQILSPYTRQRLNEVKTDESLNISFDVNVVEVASTEQGQFRINAKDGRHWNTENRPILGTGFIKGGGAQQIKDLWMWDDDGHVALSEIDESIYTPGLFLVGPQVQHNQQIYCFIYKFRQRFARISQQIALRLQLDFYPLEESEGGDWGPFGNNECCTDCEC